MNANSATDVDGPKDLMGQTVIHRIEIHPRDGQCDPRADALVRSAHSSLGIRVREVRSADVYLIEGSLTADEVVHLATELMSDAVIQRAIQGSAPVSTGFRVIEVHPLPGVMDPAGQSVEMLVETLLGKKVSVRSGARFDLAGIDASQAEMLGVRLLANPLIHAIHHAPYHPAALPHGHVAPFAVQEIAIRDLSDSELELLSRRSHLFLSLEEMQAIQAEFRRLGREPRDIELETLAQTWSEHCVHKTLKANIRYREIGKQRSITMPGLQKEAENREGLGGVISFFTGDIGLRPGHEVNEDGSVTICNLLKSTIGAATRELTDPDAENRIDWALSVFVDNSGVIAFDEEWGVCFKCETHNHPSALEPYGGAATGIGGCIRDIIGTGLAARPIASTDVFCVAHPEIASVPAGCLHPRRVLTQVVAGVRDYGNRMGIPTVNGTVWFDDRYIGNPLVFCGCIGLIPRDMVRGQVKDGDHIIAIGGRTGRDGIHGATFSSAELTDTHADEFGHAVQIGNAITEKKVLDVILQARDHADGCLFDAITDCGAGGFSSAVGEMGKELGAEIHLDRAPLKYDGLTYTEIWISEAQERMVLAVPPRHLTTLRHLCEVENVEFCDLGVFGTPERDLVLFYRDVEVGRLPMDFLHDGIPTPQRDAVWNPDTSAAGWSVATSAPASVRSPLTVADVLLGLLAHPNIASKHWIIRQYDHEVQGGTVVKPLCGPDGHGPSDAAVIAPVLESARGLAIANGLANGLCADPYWMALAAVDECIRNLVCVGADPSRIALLDNFCWPSCNKPENLGSLVRAAEGCYDAAKAYRTPFISGKDSLNNQFTTEKGETIEIPPTLLISGFGVLRDSARALTMDAKRPGGLLIVVGLTGHELGGAQVGSFSSSSPDVAREITAAGHLLPRVDLDLAPRLASTVAALISEGVVRSAHDCSEGGLLVAAAEMAFAGNVGLAVDFSNLPVSTSARIGEPGMVAKCFAESPARYLLEADRWDLDRISALLDGLPWGIIGEFNETDRFTLEEVALDLSLADLKRAWRAPLNW